MKTEHKIKAQYAEEAALKALLHAQTTLEANMRELDRYIEKFKEASTPKDKAAVLNWSLNHLVCNITPNLRLDLIANAQAELARTESFPKGESI
jgi:methionine aminopeptidase